jgi:cobalt-zinc-cadmium efflux system membrane fusion protein
MLMLTTTQAMHAHHGEIHPTPPAPVASSHPPADVAAQPAAPRKGRRLGLLLLLLLLIPLAAGAGYVLGWDPRSLFGARKEEEPPKTVDSATTPGLSLVAGQPHTVAVPADVSAALGIRKGGLESIVVAKVPTTMPPLVLPGSTALDPTRLARIRARFAPARVVSLGQVWDSDPKSGFTEFRELRPGDNVSKGDLLGVFYSADVGSKKNDLLDALVQLELDQRVLDEAEKHAEAVAGVFLLTYTRAVQGDRNAINRALNNLKVWDIPQSEIDELHAEAKKISADKNAWSKTPEGRWVRGEKQAAGEKSGSETQIENPWGRVTLRAPFDGVIIERNVHVDEVVVDNTVNLFQISDVNRLLVIASCPEDALPTLESLHGDQKRWSVHTVGAATDEGLPGTIDEIGYVIDPNQHTAVIKGYVDNPGKRIRAGQYVTTTVNLPPPDGVVEVPTDAVVDDGLQSVVFVQPDEAVNQFTCRRVQVTHRFKDTVFVRSTPISEKERLTTREAEEGLLPKQPLLPGERVITSGTVELKAAMQDLESRSEAMENAQKDVANARSKTDSQPQPPK